MLEAFVTKAVLQTSRVTWWEGQENFKTGFVKVFKSYVKPEYIVQLV